MGRSELSRNGVQNKQVNFNIPKTCDSSTLDNSCNPVENLQFQLTSDLTRLISHKHELDTQIQEKKQEQFKEQKECDRTMREWRNFSNIK